MARKILRNLKHFPKIPSKYKDLPIFGLTKFSLNLPDQAFKSAFPCAAAPRQATE
jgi:hypothetical protein